MDRISRSIALAGFVLGLVSAGPAAGQVIENGPAYTTLTTGDACPEGTAPYPGGMLYGAIGTIDTPNRYDYRDWMCDGLGDRWVRISGGRFLGGRAHGCRTVDAAPGPVAGLSCAPSFGMMTRPMVVSPWVAITPEVRVRVARGDYVCPEGAVPMSVDVARALAAAGPALCDAIGDSPVRLVPQGVMGGHRFGCNISDALPDRLTATLCVEASLDEPQIIPDADGEPTVHEFAARKLDGTPLARVFFSFEKVPGSWTPNRMYWAPPAAGGPSWSPDGHTSFRLVPVARHTAAAALPTLTPGRKAFSNRGKNVSWTGEAWPIVPQYRIVERKDAGMSVLPDGTLRFYAATYTGTLFDKAEVTITFEVNEGPEKRVLSLVRSVDDTPTAD